MSSCSCRKIGLSIITSEHWRAFADSTIPKALMLPNGRSVFYQPDSENPNGYLLPFHLDTHATSAQKIPSTSHAWAVQHAAERLEQAGVSWKVYQHEDGHRYNMLHNFRVFQQADQSSPLYAK